MHSAFEHSNQTQSHDLVTSPAFAVIRAADEFHEKTTRPNQLWQTDFTNLKVIGWGWLHLSTTPDMPAAEYTSDTRAQAIVNKAKGLNDKREAWLNPPELVRRVRDVGAGYPD